MDNLPPQSTRSQLRPIRYGRVGSIPPGGVNLIQPSPIVAAMPPPARVPSSPTATQQQPTVRSITRETTPSGTQIMPARSQVQVSERTLPTLAPPAAVGVTAIPAAAVRAGSPQLSASDSESPVTIKADTVTQVPSPVHAPSRSAIAHPVPEPVSPVDPVKASANGPSNGNGGDPAGDAERGLFRRSSSRTPPPPPSPRSSGEEEIKKSFPAGDQHNSRNGGGGGGGSMTGSEKGSAVPAGFGLLTMAGENTGAYMELARGGSGYPRRGDVVDSRTVKGGAAGKAHRIPADQGVWAQQRRTDGESGNGSSRKDMVNPSAGAPAHRTRPMTALVNSNVQGVNNSILFQSSCCHGSPGVHVALSRGISNHSRPRHNGVHTAAESAGSRS